MVPRAMDKRGKCRAFPTKEQENRRVELDANAGSIPIGRSTLKVYAKQEKAGGHDARRLRSPYLIVN